MAQVRKFDVGGKTVDIGGYTFNTNNKEDMKILQELASQHGGVGQEVLDNVNHSGYSNTLKAYLTSDGRVMVEGSLSDVKNDHMSKKMQKATSREDNFINNLFARPEKREWANNYSAYIKEAARRKQEAIEASKKEDEKKKSESNDNKKKITGVNGSWEYNKNNTWDDKAINNAVMMKQWNLLKEYANATDKSNYDVSDLNGEKLEAFLDMYKANPNLFSQYENSFKAGAQKLPEDSGFYSTFGWFGFNNGITPKIEAEREKKEEEDKFKKTYADAGWDYDTWKDYGYINEDGSLELYKGVLSDYSGNHWFGDRWESNRANPNEMFLRDHIKIGNRLYKASDASDDKSALYNYLRRRGGFYEMNANGDYEGSNNLIQWIYDTPVYQTVDPNNIGSFYETGYLYDPTNRRISTTTWKNGTLNEGDQIVSYVDPKGITDDFGLRNTAFGIVDKGGNLIHKGLSEEDFTDLYGGGSKEVQDVQKWLYWQRASNDPEQKFLYNRYKETSGGESEENPYFTFYTDPNTGMITMVPGSYLTNKTLGPGVGINLSQERGQKIKDLFMSDLIKNKIATDPTFAKRLQNVIMSLTGTDIQDAFKANLADIDKIAEDYNIPESDAKLIVEEFYNRGSNTDDSEKKKVSKRRSNYLQYIYKDGGTLKAQGGIALNAGTKERDTHKELNKDTKVVDKSEAGSLDQILSRADKAELIATAGDVFATVAGLAGPVGDWVGSGAGILASGTRFGANISRDGFQIGDLGRFAMDAGLDLLGLAPVLGDAGRAAKTIKAVQKASSILSPLFITFGLGAAASSVDKAIKGEKFTVQDWSNLAAGFQALTNAGVLGKKRWNRAKIDSLASKMKGEINISPRTIDIDGKKVTLSAEDIKTNIQGKSKEEVVKFLKNKAKDAGVEVNKLPKDIVKEFGLKTSGVGKWGNVTDPDMPTQRKEISTFGSFVRPGLNKRIDDNISDVAKVLDDPKVNKRTAASIASEYELGGPETTNWWGWTIRGKNNTPRRQQATSYTPTFEYTPETSGNYLPSPIRGRYEIFGTDFDGNVIYRNPKQEVEFPPTVDIARRREAIRQYRLRKMFEEREQTGWLKKGGVLKGQKGLFDIVTNFVKDNQIDLLQPNVGTNLDIAGMARRSSLTTEPFEEPVPKTQTFATDYARDHDNKHAQIWAKERSIADPSSARPDSGRFDPGKAFWIREGLDAWNYRNAKNTAKTARDLGYKTADIMGGLQMSMPVEQSFKYNLPINNELEQKIAKYNTAISQFNTNSDINAANATKLAMLDNSAEMRDAKARDVSKAVSEQDLLRDQRREQYNQLRADIANKNKQLRTEALLSKVQADAAYNLENQRLKDARFYKFQNMANKWGLVDSDIQNKIDQATLRMNLPGVKPEQRSSLNDMINTLKSSDYRNIALRSALFAKNGSKLRSTSDTMLLNNQKAVAKAIEKINDSTMKLILKALS